MKKLFTKISLMAVALLFMGVTSAMAAEWSINFSEIGTNNKLADKAGATISDEVVGGMGTVTLGEALNSNFGIQTGTTWLYRTAQKALYQGNGGGRNFGVFNAIKDQLITLDISAAPTPTNATLQSTNGNVRVYKVTNDGTVTFNLARYNYIYSISVENPSATDKNYTIKYVDGSGNELKSSATKSGTPGASITVDASDKASFTADGKKYIYVSDDASGKKIADDESTVVTITFREASSYTVNAKYDGNVISTASVFEGDNGYVNAPYYQFVAGTLYGTPAVDKGSLSYGQITVNNITADTDVNVTYTADGNQNAVFYSEAENIASLTAYSDQYTQGRMSNGAVAYAVADGTVIATLPAGKYTLTSSSRAGTSKFFAGDVNVLELVSTGAVVTTTGAEFVLTESTDITVNAGSKNAYFDYVLIRKTGEASIDATISAAEYATFSAPFATTIPAGVTAYTVTVKDASTVTLAAIEDGVIPANTGVIIKGAAGAYSFVQSATAGSAKSILTATLAETEITASDYVLGNDANGVGFYHLTEGNKVGANKAYLTLVAGAKFVGFNFDDVTAANVVTEAKAESKAVKFVKNGQLLIKTVNGVVNAAGAQVK